MASVLYRDTGVDIDRADQFVERIRSMAAATRTPHVLSGVGGFAGLCSLPSGMAEPVLVSGTDGVGTKLKVAFLTGVHHTVGIDLVAMCVNDVLTTGATPLFFLDYFATGKLDPDQGEQIVRGIAEGCKRAGCALLGGETAEMPGFYPEGEYDLAGFAVGVVDRKLIVDGANVREGDVVIGVASSGLHSNGYSLARHVLLERAQLGLDATIAGTTVRDWLLKPTRIYTAAVRAALEAGGIHALCHITGGGLPGNLPRVLPTRVGVELERGAWEVPAIFDEIALRGAVPSDEMERVFNLGLGLVIVAEASKAHAIIEAVASSGEHAYRVGSIVPRGEHGPSVRLV